MATPGTKGEYGYRQHTGLVLDLASGGVFPLMRRAAIPRGYGMAAPKLVRDIMSTNLTTLDHESHLLDAVLLMRSSGYRHLPVVNGDKLVGIISDRDVQRAAPSLLSKISQEEYNRIFEGTPISRIMVKDVITVSPTTPVREAVRIAYENKFGCVPVVEGDKKLVGIVTVTDLLGVLDRLLEES